MITQRTSGPAETSKLHYRRALSVAAGLLCLSAFSPSAMTATLVGVSTGPGYVASDLGSGLNATSFNYNFNGSNGLNVIDWDSSLAGMGYAGNEDFTIRVSLPTAPALGSSFNADPDTGLGMLRIRWTRDPIIDAAGAPEDDQWNDNPTGIVTCFGGCSVSHNRTIVTATYYDVLLEFDNPLSAGIATINWDWSNFNFSGAGQGGPFSIELEPGYVPVPPALWLFGSGLLAVAGISRRRSEENGSTAKRPVAAGAR